MGELLLQGDFIKVTTSEVADTIIIILQSVYYFEIEIERSSVYFILNKNEETCNCIV